MRDYRLSYPIAGQDTLISGLSGQLKLRHDRLRELALELRFNFALLWISLL